MVYRMFVFTLVMALAGIVGFGQKAATDTSTTPTSQQAIATAQSLHDQMNQLEVAGDLNGQAKYFSDNIVRMDNNRPIETGKAAWLASQTALRTGPRGFKVQSISTRVANAWVEGNRLYEYGNTSMTILLDGTIIDDPTKYFGVWVLGNPGGPQLELLIWNVTGSVSSAKATSPEPVIKAQGQN